MFLGFHSPETRVSVNVMLRLIGPPRGCPLKAMRFTLKKFQGCTPKAIPPAHQPHRSRACDLWLGSPSVNYCIWKELEHGRKRNKARLLQRKMSFLTVSLHSSQEGTRTRTNHLMTVIQQTLQRSLRPQAGNVYYDHVKMGGTVGAN